VTGGEADLGAGLVWLGPLDGGRLASLRRTALTADPDAFYRTVAEEADHPADHWVDRLSDPRSHWVIGVDEQGRDVALGAVVPYHEDPRDLTVISVWVQPTARGRGIARALMVALIERACIDAPPGVTLWVADVNAAAEALYEELGFERTGRTGCFPPAARAHHRARAPARPATGRLSACDDRAQSVRSSQTNVVVSPVSQSRRRML